MANFFDNLGLGLINESEENFRRLALGAARDGKVIKTYSGNPYINAHYGDVDIIVRLEHNEDQNKYDIVGVDTQTAGRCVWDLRVVSDVTPPEAGITEKRILAARAEDNSGMLVVNVVNSDVLPSYMEDDIVKLQVVAFATDIDYYENEEAYEAAQPDWHNGRKMMPAEGSII